MGAGRDFQQIVRVGTQTLSVEDRTVFRCLYALSAVYTFHFKLHFTVDHPFLLLSLSVCTFDLSCY